MSIHRLFFILALAALLGERSFADEPPVKIEHGWVRALPPTSSDSVAYMTLVNSSDQTVRLTGGSTPIAETVMPMAITKKAVNGEEVMGMEMVNELAIPAHGQLALAPGGAHLMLMKLKEHPKVGDKVKLTLRFEPGGKALTTELPVALNSP